jgi:hypothetical protein
VEHEDRVVKNITITLDEETARWAASKPPIGT